ncbi:hypothetical protein DFH06DRAFT_373326 [Mycena polygramma]|nr:hypothetical protein DFH06DRAFT_373326 [Mycena polygramma]
MLQAALPYTLEDRTGAYTASDFDDIYDRLFFHVATTPQRAGSSAVMIYAMPRRASRHRDSRPVRHAPAAVLEFLADGSLGNVAFAQGGGVGRGGGGGGGTLTLPMARYLRKTSLFGRSLSRKFMCSDGREYKWVHRSVEGQEWTCTPASATVTDPSHNYLVAHYDLKPADVRAYGVSGNTLTIYEPFAGLGLELLASFIIMRHIQQYNL